MACYTKPTTKLPTSFILPIFFFKSPQFMLCCESRKNKKNNNSATEICLGFFSSSDIHIKLYLDDVI